MIDTCVFSWRHHTRFDLFRDALLWTSAVAHAREHFPHVLLVADAPGRALLHDSLGLPFTDGEYGVQSDAFVLEANYDIPVYRGVNVQPEVEYFIRPGGQRAVHNALVLGLKTHVLF